MPANTEDKCVLKPGETCAFCNHTRPKKQPKARIVCHVCAQPFIKGVPKRLLRGKWVHKNQDDCFAA